MQIKSLAPPHDTPLLITFLLQHAQYFEEPGALLALGASRFAANMIALRKTYNKTTPCYPRNPVFLELGRIFVVCHVVGLRLF
jgi:hypothetical protein